jgi:hypothetical protein
MNMQKMFTKEAIDGNLDPVGREKKLTMLLLF